MLFAPAPVLFAAPLLARTVLFAAPAPAAAVLLAAAVLFAAAPVAVLLAGLDVVVPNRFGRRLYEAYAGPKKLWEIPTASHNDLCDRPAEWWKELFAFWNR